MLSVFCPWRQLFRERIWVGVYTRVALTHVGIYPYLLSADCSIVYQRLEPRRRLLLADDRLIGGTGRPCSPSTTACLERSVIGSASSWWDFVAVRVASRSETLWSPMRQERIPEALCVSSSGLKSCQGSGFCPAQNGWLTSSRRRKKSAWTDSNSNLMFSVYCAKMLYRKYIWRRRCVSK